MALNCIPTPTKSTDLVLFKFYLLLKFGNKNKYNKDILQLDLDTLLPVIGQFGRYQKLLVWLVCLPACIPCGLCAFNQLFMTDTPHQFWCAVPELARASNLSAVARRDLSIPFDSVSAYSL